MRGKNLGMDAMNAHPRSEAVGNGTNSGCAAIDELDGDGLIMLNRLQLLLNQDGGVQETVGCARVEKSLNGDGSWPGTMRWTSKQKEAEGTQ